jgi:hypothetical protein
MILLSSASDPKWRSEFFITPLLRFDRSIGPVHLGDSEFSLYYSTGFVCVKRVFHKKLILTDCPGGSYHERKNNDQEVLAIFILATNRDMVALHSFQINRFTW